ncbi:MAG: segregation/condensation protein A [Phycisphaerae bacterium]|nr:segregation/condensation protein A [Phycisphaerae bacterium]
MDEYRIQTETYSGPMELLLYLIKRDEIDLHNLPVAHITRQYCDYVSMLKVIDPNVAGEFLVMATILMELKSRLLLPRPPADDMTDDDDLTDPRLELVKQLLEYKKFKDASFELQEAADRQAMRWPRVPAKLRAKDPSEVDLDDVQIWDLVAAFNRVMTAIGAANVTHDVIFDDTPISLHAADIVDQIDREGGELTFDRIFAGRRKPEMIGLFLALLELMRQSRVRVTQEHPASPIVVKLLSAEPISVGAEWGEAFETAVLGHEIESVAPAGPIGGNDGADEALEVESATMSRSAVPAANAEMPLITGLEFDEEIDPQAAAELDAIRTEIDVDAILKAAEMPGTSDESSA